MNGEFNKKILFDNISFLVKELGKKIGEIETAAGVSPGYISRSAKEGGAKPGIDFIVKVADVLNTTVDTLINTNLTELSATERYLISFIEKLKSDTVSDKLEWEYSSADSLNRLEQPNGHPLFSYETFYEQSEVDYPDEVSRIVFVSHTFNCHTSINGGCFSLKLKDNAVLHLMNICKSVHRVNDPNAYAKELWISKPFSSTDFLCSNTDKTSPFSELLDDLYEAISEYAKHPKIKKDLQSVIDAFMNDDLGTDLDDDIPF